ncbi:MAG: DUF2284 domain-containing protein [Rikenellaceae bacterium]
MGKTEFKLAKISVSEYKREYQNIEKVRCICKGCPNYGKRWGCPPFEPEEDAKIDTFNFAYIMATKIYIDDSYLDKTYDGKQFAKVCQEILVAQRKIIDKKLVELEDSTPFSQSFYGGACIGCGYEKCSRSEGKPCTKSATIRPSLESMGFEVSKTTSNLLNIEILWSKDGKLPEYYTLVYAIFSKESIEDSKFEIFRN